MQHPDVARSLTLTDDAAGEDQEPSVERIGPVGSSMDGRPALLHAQAGGVDAVVTFHASLGSEHYGLIPCPERGIRLRTRT